MIGRLNHVAIAVPDLKKASTFYRDILGAKVSDSYELSEHGVKAVFVELPNTKIELLEPLGNKSPLNSFLSKSEKGGIHHLCYEVNDIEIAIKSLKNKGAKILGNGESTIGAHGKPVVFLHPKDNFGTLIELEQA